ncbi:MAG: hypothetical protein ACOZCO_15750, partial [Bacteroidota bacterium]
METVSNDKQIKRFDFSPTSGSNQSYEFEVDKTAEFVTAVVLTSDRDDRLFYRGSCKIEIGGVEHLPENFEAKLLMCGINVAPNSRVYQLGNVPVGNGKVKITYKDTNHPDAPL